MKNLKIVMLIVFAGLAASCSDDDNNEFVLPEQHANLLTKTVDSDDGLTRIYTYDADSRCTGYQSGTDPNAMDSFTFHYNTDGTLDELTQDNAADASIEKYFYSAEGKLIKKIGRNGLDIYLYTYQGNTITEDYRFTNTNSGFVQKYTLDGNGNPIELKVYDNSSDGNPSGTYAGTMKYTYDDKKASGTSLPKAYGFPKSVNNEVSRQYNDQAQQTTVYQYNVDGYPTQSTNGFTRVFTYQRL